MAREKNEVSAARRVKHGAAWTIFFTVLSIFWILPLLIVLMNSFKRKAYIFKAPFSLSYIPLSRGFDRWAAGISKTFVGLKNYANAIQKTDFFKCFGYSIFFIVVSVLLIVLFCSMTAWYVVRVKSVLSTTIYVLCMFSMIVPFQMVMFTLSKFANILHLSNPVGITIVYLGFGAGLAVFMFTGFVKEIPIELEEAACIDGCTPVQCFFRVIMPVMKPEIITVSILDAMWIWNDFLLPYLVLDIKKYRTIPIAVQFLKQSHGQIDWGAMMAVLVLAIIPIVIFYMAVQKYIIEGVVAGAVKG